MGYRNLNSGNLRAQRRQQSRLSTQAPVGGSSVGHGSGLRFYDGGELLIDGLNTGMRFWVQETGGGNSVARLQFTFEDMTNIASQPAVWSQATTNSLNLAGPLNFDSTAGDGYGGSNLFLYGNRASLVAGEAGESTVRLNLWDDGRAHLITPNARLNLQDGGHVGLYGLNGELYINENGSHGMDDGSGRGYWVNGNGSARLQSANGSLHLNASGHVGLYGSAVDMYFNTNGSMGIEAIRSALYLNSDNSLSLRNQHGRGFSVSDGGTALVSGATASIQGPDGVFLGTGDGGAGYNSHSDGRFYIGSSGKAIIQGESNGALNMWAPSGGQFNGDFTVAGSKNFIMDHPEKPGHTIKYAATESPVSGIEDRGRVTIGDNGTAQIIFPEHFTAIVKDNTDVDVFLQTYGPVPAWCDVPTKEGATVHGEPGTIVAWHALAERTGADFTVVEKGSIQTQPEPQPETEGQQWQQQQPSPQK